MSYIYIMALVDNNEIPEEARPLLKDSKHGPHCTLLFLGELTDNPARVKKGMEEVARNIIKHWGCVGGPLVGTFGGVGRFSASESSEGLDVIYLSVDSPELFDFRHNLMNEVYEESLSLPEPDNSHGFVPHTTLKFIGKDEPMPIQRVGITKVDLSRIRIVVGKEFLDFHVILGDPETLEWQSLSTAPPS